jgi:uncharacterized protein
MSAENVETVCRLFEAVEARDLAGTLAKYDPDIVIREASFLPYGGTYHGHEGAQRHARGFVSAWDKSQQGKEKRLDPVYLDGGDRIVVLYRLKGLAAESGRKINVPVVGTYRVRNGKVVEAQMFYSDTAEITQFMAETVGR